MLPVTFSITTLLNVKDRMQNVVDGAVEPSGLVGFQLAFGAVIGLLERRSVSESIYFTFVTALTIGYGDLAPKRISTRMIALAVAFSGILLTALVAAIGVRLLYDCGSCGNQ